VTFTPNAAGQRTATLNVADNANGSPQTVSLSGNGCMDIILSWRASSALGVIGYYIYRGTVSGRESGAPLNSAPVSGTTYVDTNVTAGTTYYYVLTSDGTNRVQSAPSSETEAKLPTS
jgi:fibronectin type 3 domain-containing protein